VRVNSCAHEILTPSTQGLVGAWNYAFRRSRGDFQECINLYNITSLMDLPEVFERFLSGLTLLTRSIPHPGKDYIKLSRAIELYCTN